MIKLENISSERLISNPIECKNGSFYPENMQGLSDFYKEFKNYIIKADEVKKEIERAKKQMDKANIAGINPDTYDIRDNMNNVLLDYYDKLLIDRTDKTTIGKELISNPSIYSDIRSYRYLTIEVIKFLLRHCDPKGKNALEASCRSIGKAELRKIIEMIKMYDEQVLRQCYEYQYNKRNKIQIMSYTNLFDFQKEEKNEIVKDNLKEYVEYLLDNTSESFVWGPASANQKKILLSATRNENHVRANLINTISNYTTLSELKEDPIQNHTLKRFIRK